MDKKNNLTQYFIKELVYKSKELGVNLRRIFENYLNNYSATNNQPKYTKTVAKSS